MTLDELLRKVTDLCAFLHGRTETEMGTSEPKEFLITYEAHVGTCALARDPIRAASMASCNSFGQCWATVTRSRRRKPLG